MQVSKIQQNKKWVTFCSGDYNFIYYLFGSRNVIKKTKEL